MSAGPEGPRRKTVDERTKELLDATVAKHLLPSFVSTLSQEDAFRLTFALGDLCRTIVELRDTNLRMLFAKPVRLLVEGPISFRLEADGEKVYTAFVNGSTE